jgi:Tol biopolymer transport system component/predicted Ser/Thr protein kinase
MELKPGDKLGPYEIVSPIGQGGMGEVWKARDPRLDRMVAIKVSRAGFTERFKQEARLVAQLNHPNICTLHDVGPNYLVMEFVEGVPLKGPLPVEKAVEYAGQILDALDAAHRKSIVHRDLKPANILVTKQGIKLLDFGLAKQAPGLGPDDVTIHAMTAEGQISGTLQYMAPEQLHGKEADARSDIFAFGCVLYEMLSGAKAFSGSSAASVIAAILDRPAPSVTDVAPPALDRVLKRCLEKDPENRWQTARDLKAELEWIAGAAPQIEAGDPSRSRFGLVMAAVAGVMAVLAAGVGFIHFREKPLEANRMRFEIPEPENRGNYSLALSSDGRKLAFLGPGGLWIRDLDSLESRLLPGTDDVATATFFWSPDGRFLGYVAGQGRKLMKIDISGGRPETLGDVPGDMLGGTWNQDGLIVLGRLDGPLSRVSQSGGTAAPLMNRDASIGEIRQIWPYLLPDRKHLVYQAASSQTERNGIYLATLDGKDRKLLVQRAEISPLGEMLAYAPPAASGELGHLLFLRNGALLALALNSRSFEPAGEAFRVADDVAAFSVSSNGVLAYQKGTAAGTQSLRWFDRTGKPLGNLGPPANRYADPTFSPDGKRVAVSKEDSPRTLDIWLIDVARGVPTRLTFDSRDDRFFAWSPDGSRLAYVSGFGRAHTEMYVKNTDGTGNPELIYKSSNDLAATSWSSNGKFLLFGENTAKTGQDLFTLPMDRKAAERKPIPYLQTPFQEFAGRFSPDPESHYVLYLSNESGKFEAYVQSFPPGGGKFQISNGGARGVRWSRDGKEIFYNSLDGNALFSVKVKTAPKFEAEVPKPLFRTEGGNVGAVATFDVTPDGNRFLVITAAQAPDSGSAPKITVVVNWTAGLAK